MFCVSIAFTTSSALAISPPASPRNANARPTADVSQFSRLEVLLMRLESRTSSAKPVLATLPAASFITALITTLTSSALTSSVSTDHPSNSSSFLKSSILLATVRYVLSPICTSPLFASAMINTRASCFRNRQARSGLHLAPARRPHNHLPAPGALAPDP